MAENNGDSVINGVNGESPSEFFDDTDFPPLKSPQTPSVVDSDRLRTRLAELEADRSESESRVAELTAELEKLRVEKENELDAVRAEKETESARTESNRKAAEDAAKRASELEGEVARLQHDLISASSDASEATREIEKLTAEVAALKAEKAEVEGKVTAMEARMEELVKKSDVSEKLIGEFTAKFAEEAETVAVAADDERNVRSFDVDGGHEWKGIKEKLPVIGAVTVGIVVVAGVVCHVRYSRN
ncbi:hypothetical protein vseg_021312 [Gypsophila vaccaria]